MTSRQYEWQKERKESGKCVVCGKPRKPNNSNHCEKHAEMHSARELKRYYANKAKKDDICS